MQTPDKLWNWKYIVYIGLQTVNFALFYMAFPIVPKYAVSVGIGLGMAGVLAGGFAIASLISRPISGYCIDHFPRKMIMFAALIICGLSTAALVLTSHWLSLLALRVVYGAGFSFFTTMLVSCVADFIPKKKMAEGISYFGLGVALAASIGPPVGLFIADQLGERTLFVMMGVMNLLCAAVILFVPVAPKEQSEEGVRFSISGFVEKGTIIFAVLVIPFSFGNGFINSFIALSSEERHIAGFSMFFTVFAVGMMVLKPISGKVQDKWGLTAVLVPAFICTAAASGIISIAYSLPLLLVAAVLQAFGQGAGQPGLLASSVSCVPESRRGASIGTYYMGLDMGIAIGNISGSQVAESLGYGKAYMLCGVLLLAGLAVYIVYELVRKKRKEK